MYLTISLVLLAPLAFAYWKTHNTDIASYGFNGSATGFLPTTCSVICSNVGVGTFVAILLFSHTSPIIGIALVICYSAGLLFCALFAPAIHRMSRQTGAYTLVDLIASRHGCKNRGLLAVWIPIAIIFILRSSVQMAALGLIASELTGLTAMTSLFLATVFVASYTLFGGYRAATETDIVQAITIVVLMGFALGGLSYLQPDYSAFFALGPYEPSLLVGIFLFVPFSPILGIDNWQRMATAQSPQTARHGFLAGAAVCAAIYLTIWFVGIGSAGVGLNAIATFRDLMPASAPWLADVLILTCIISSIDTFVMPLVSTFAKPGQSVSFLRLLTALIFITVGLTAAFLGDLLDGVIAAFSSLIVFLPAIAGAFFLKRSPPSAAAWISMNIGLIVTLALVLIDNNIAALGGFAASVISYGASVQFCRSRSIFTD